MNSREDPRPAAGAGTNPYFFLSYAHSAPLAGEDPEPTDYWVADVFNDLSAAVRREAGLEHGSAVGFFDGLLKADENWKTRVTRELNEANVFVPLYSPKYFSMTVPGREWACFTSRLFDDSPEELRAHLVPVLWAPMAGTTGPPGLPDPLGPIGDMAAYAENGLRALRALNHFSVQYHQVLARLAARIVVAARERPLAAGAATPIDRVQSAFHYKGVEDDFVIAVAAPTAGNAPAGRDTSWYGAAATDWHPFGELGSLPLAEYTLSIAERLSFNTSVLTVQEAAGETAPTPGIVLIDPWIAAGRHQDESDALPALRRLFERAQPQEWMLPVVVLDRNDAGSMACQDTLVPIIARILAEVGAPSAEASTREGVVTSFGAFRDRMPGLVAEAERRFLRYGPDSPNDHGGEGRAAPGRASSPPDSEGWVQRGGSST